MNILVTGANGQLGNEMRIVTKSSPDCYIFTDVNQAEGLDTTYLDITDLDAIRKVVVDNDIKAIVNCAAWTNVDACETDENLAALAQKLNAEAPKNLATAMKEADGVLFISPPTTSSAKNHTTLLVSPISKALRQEYMAPPRSREKKTSLLPAANT